MSSRVNFETHPDQYHHWRIDFRPPIATLILDVDETAGFFTGYELKLNSYDIGVDIELHDAVQRLRFEHPEIKAVMITSGKANTFCAGANIRMLAGASHVHKVNFCKFTNETRNAIEDATNYSQQIYVAAINGPAAGGGYELALAADKILLVDDGNAVVSLPEVPLLAVLPGTGGLTRIIEKRKVRRDLADHFCTLEEGLRGERAVASRFIDEAIPRSQFNQRCDEIMAQTANLSDRSDDTGILLTPLEKFITADKIEYQWVSVEIDRDHATASLTIKSPTTSIPLEVTSAQQSGASFWPLAVMREFDDALLELRFNEPETGTLFLKTQGNAGVVAEFDAFVESNNAHWFVREVNLHTRRVLKRLDLMARSLFALIEPGSCFTGFLAEIAFAADRSFMLEGTFEDQNNLPAAAIQLSIANFGRYTSINNLSRLQMRFYGEPESLDKAQSQIGNRLDAKAAEQLGLVTLALDDLDWDDEIRLLREARAGFSPDALTGMEANLRFPGPETMESKIFARLTAWQNWIFQRPNAVGPNGALPLYGTGKRPEFDKTRV